MNSRLLTLALLTASAVPHAQADTLIVTRDGTLGSEANATTTRFWSGDDRMARIDANGRMVVDLADQMLYIVNDQAGTCYAMSTSTSDRDPEALKAAAEAVTFRRTGRTEQIGEWQTEVLELTTGSGDEAMELVVWVSDEIEIDAGQRAYTESVATPETAWMLALYDQGFPVRQEVKMGPVAMWSELESIEEKNAPAGTYAVPDGCD